MIALKYKNKETGFAGLEALLVVFIVLVIAAMGVYVLHRHSDDKLQSLSSANSSAPSGTSESVSQITALDASSESNIDKSADSNYKQDASSSNSAASNVGGAYNEANY
jgi:type II secretory pathway pseudopilin PulG